MATLYNLMITLGRLKKNSIEEFTLKRIKKFAETQ